MWAWVYQWLDRRGDEDGWRRLRGGVGFRGAGEGRRNEDRRRQKDRTACRRGACRRETRQDARALPKRP